jgi:glycosyltransferase involved in cell wall biosynthesis
LDLSIIVPLFNEEENVFPLYRSIVSALDPLALDYELILVDDGSSDSTAARARDLAEKEKRLKVVILRRNYGQTAAMAAGIDHARGEILVTMDGDLQNDPADIPALIEQIRAGYDVAVGWRYKRQDKLITRRIPSLIANWLIGRVTGVPIRDNGCSLKAYRADVIQQIPLYSEMHRFIPAMASMAGARIVQIRVRHHARRFGLSKYGLSRIYKVLFDLLAIKTLMVSAQRPMAWFGWLAAPVLLLGVVSVGYSLYLMTFGGTGALPLAGVGMMLGALFVFLLMSGALAELLLRTGDPAVLRLPMLAIESDRASATLPGCPQSQERKSDA